MKNFSDILAKMQGIDSKKLQKGVKVTISAQKAVEIFGENVIRREVGTIEVRIRWVRDRENDKPIRADLTLRLLP